MSEFKNFQKLCDAIVIQAADDYRKLLCKKHNSKNQDSRIDGAIKELEKFFCGDLITLYTRVDGKFLMKSLQMEMEKSNYKFSVSRYKATKESKR